MRVWLLEVNIAGHIYRWAVDGHYVENANGDTLVYRPGLNDFSASASDDSLTLDIADSSVDWTELGPLLDGSSVVARRWTVGSLLEAADITFRGVVDGSQYGSSEEPVTISVAEIQGDAGLGTQAPDIQAVVNNKTWPVDADTTLPDHKDGASYPVIFGYPGYSSDNETVTAVVPVPMCQLSVDDPTQTLLLISEDARADITQVLVRNDSEGIEAEESVIPYTDNLGRDVLVAMFDQDNTLAPVADTDSFEFFVGFHPDWGGGIHRQVYNVIAYLLERWDQNGVDWSKMPQVEDILAPFIADTWIDDPVENPWALIQDTFLPLLPVEIKMGVDGRYLAPSWFRPFGRPVATIRQGYNASRDGRVSTELPRRNEFTILYGYNRNDHPKFSYTLTSGDTPASTSGLDAAGSSRVVFDARCAFSQSRFGVITGEPVEADWVWQTATAAAIAAWMVDADASRHTYYTYTMNRYSDIQSNDEVRVVDTELDIDVLGMVEGAPVEGPDGISVTVVVVDDGP